MQNNNNAFHLCSKALSHTLFSLAQTTYVMWKTWGGGVFWKGYHLSLVCRSQEVVLLGFIHSFFIKCISRSYYMPDSAPFPLELTPSLLIRCFPSFQVIPNALPQSHLLWFLFISSYSIFGGKESCCSPLSI